LVGTVTANVNVAGRPALGGVVGGVITRPGAVATFTFTVPDADPVLVPPVVPPPVVPPPVPVPACTPTLAVTVAVVDVESVDVATPFTSVTLTLGAIVPASVENATVAEGSALPFRSETSAEMIDVPPVAGMSVGFALTTTRPTAARPIAIFTTFVAVVVVVVEVLVPVEDPLWVVPPAPPEIAVIVAVPFELPAWNATTARPLTSVSASDGTTVPSDVVKITCVPECGGVPDASITCAMICVVPFSGSAVARDVNVIVDPVGASSGTLSQAICRTPAIAAHIATVATARKERAIFKILSILVP